MTLPTLAPPKDCTGCSACRAACPRDAIAMLPDAEGFLRPNIDAAKCVGCHVCERACPILIPGRPDPTCFAARAYRTLRAFIRNNTHSRGGVTPSLPFTAASLPAA